MKRWRLINIINLLIFLASKSSALKVLLEPIGIINKSIFYITNETFAFHKAVDAAKSSGGKLAEPRTEEENKLIKKYLTEHGEKVGSAWLGGKRDGGKSFCWLSDKKQPGSDGLIQDWAPNKPDKVKHSNFLGFSSPGFQWSNFPGAEKKRAILQKPRKNADQKKDEKLLPEVITITETVHKTAKMNLTSVGSDDQYQYYLTQDSFAFDVATGMAKAFGGIIAEPKTQKQIDLIKNHLKDKYGENGGDFWIGGTREGSSDSDDNPYYWLSNKERLGSGGSVQDWAPSKPDNSPEAIYIGMSAPDYKWKNYPKKHKKRVILQKDKKTNNNKHSKTYKHLFQIVEAKKTGDVPYEKKVNNSSVKRVKKIHKPQVNKVNTDASTTSTSTDASTTSTSTTTTDASKVNNNDADDIFSTASPDFHWDADAKDVTEKPLTPEDDDLFSGEKVTESRSDSGGIADLFLGDTESSSIDSGYLEGSSDVTSAPETSSGETSPDLGLFGNFFVSLGLG